MTLDQVIKELQLHIENPDLNELIKDKMTEAWRIGMRNETDNWLPLYKKMEFTMQKISKEERNKIIDSHVWVEDQGENDDKCLRCEAFYSDQYRLPTYCTEGRKLK